MKWHKVSEELPEKGKVVLLYNKIDDMELPALAIPECYYYELGIRSLIKDHDCWHMFGGHFLSFDSFTYWAEIEPPNDIITQKQKKNLGPYADIGFPSIKE